MHVYGFQILNQSAARPPMFSSFNEKKIQGISRKVKIFKNIENNMIYFFVFLPYKIGTQIIYLQAVKYYIGLKNEIENMYITIFDKGGHFLRL